MGSAAEAEQEGYIACRRCHPGQDALAPAEKGIRLALAFMELHLDEPITLAVLSRVSGLGPNHLQRVFSRVVGFSPKTFVDFRRLGRLKELLRSGMSVSDASYTAGYGS